MIRIKLMFNYIVIAAFAMPALAAGANPNGRHHIYKPSSLYVKPLDASAASDVKAKSAAERRAHLKAKEISAKKTRTSGRCDLLWYENK